MLTDSLLDQHIKDGIIPESQIDSLFAALDLVGVSALWVDKSLYRFKYNKSNDIIVDAVEKADKKDISYIDLIYVIYSIHQNNDMSPASSTANWIDKLRKLQKTPLTPDEEYVALSATGQQFITRRVILNDGSMLVISFDYVDLHRRDDLIKAAFEMSKSGVMYYNASTNDFLIESPYLKRILTDEELAAVHKYGLFAIIGRHEIEAVKEIFARAINAATVVTKNIKITTKKHGTLWFKFTGQPQKNASNNAKQFILNFKDVTEELETQENLRQHIQDSDEKLKERLDFMAKLSHELKTPMNAIVGISDALLTREGTPDDIRSKLELIQLSSEHLVNMLDNTLSHAKLRNAETALNLQDSNPKKLIGDICRLWENQALKNGTVIRFNAANDLPAKVKIDGSRLSQCLNNLISNATKFTEYGFIDIVVKLHNSPNKQHHLAIAVKDTGIGMTEEQQGKIFDAYKQADETISSRFGGTGLGMSITKDLVELMGGKISVKSEPNKGTLFLIALPINSQDIKQNVIEKDAPSSLDTTVESNSHINSDPSETKLIPTPAPAPAKKKNKATPSQVLMSKSSINATELETLNILVVDDNETNHIVMSSLLEGVVGKIYSAFDGKQALDVLTVEHIDLVLMDIHMPVMDGIEATIAIRSNPDLYPNVHIIALTADPQYQQKRLCVNIGMDEAISKPVKLVKLIETIKKTMANPVNKLAKAS